MTPKEDKTSNVWSIQNFLNLMHEIKNRLQLLYEFIQTFYMKMSSLPKHAGRYLCTPLIESVALLLSVSERDRVDVMALGGAKISIM